MTVHFFKKFWLEFRLKFLKNSIRILQKCSIKLWSAIKVSADLELANNQLTWPAPRPPGSLRLTQIVRFSHYNYRITRIFQLKFYKIPISVLMTKIPFGLVYIKFLLNQSEIRLVIRKFPALLDWSKSFSKSSKKARKKLKDILSVYHLSLGHF